jgi:L-seryl-tRNA(Ser) seleniumtransferase
MLLSTHLSNFSQSGFVESPSAPEFVELARHRGLVSCYDLGSGMLRSDPRFPEISVQQAVQQGFDLVAFSGDKLLGGPQAGIIIGRADLIARLKKNPMMRALRVDKLILAALEGTLLSYLDPHNAWNSIPVLEMLGRSLEAVRPMADLLAEGLTQLLQPLGVAPEVVLGKSSTGGGSLPGFELDTWNVRVPLPQEDLWASHLRKATPPVLVRRNAGAILLDPRTLTQAELPLVIAAFEYAISRMNSAI